MHYIPSLDGLRAVAVVAVMAYHARIGGTQGGFLGVDLFFVLSGYLITRILVEERVQTGTLRFGAFYLRRLRRLYPALLLLLAVYLAASPWLPSINGHHLTHAAITALYLSDYGVAFWRMPWFLSHTWSLSVEEHFYLIWPLVLWLILRLPKRTWLAAAVAMALAATLWRWHVVYYIDVWQQPYFRFDTRLSGLLIGAAGAIWKPSRTRWMPVMGIPLFVYAAWNAQPQDPSSLTIWMLLAELGALLLILGANRLNVLSWWPLAWLGKLSYGLYLWHFPAMLLLRGEGITGWNAMAIGGTFALACAVMSYATVERLSRSKGRDRPQPLATAPS
ncbi:acyltransferase [Stenotrophomonas sp. C3(2023)]|uniref:acyltransferase family protein n=1 Tax=Stenotrophomonas sp. C3(2023) TaxID=3080277 RepID=UPI00293C6602|nr:acyltransferase [Stenotrophomonas sp. C3(2023)]MDV3467791.1 acyltransferase [Stenotrophomonas sp. C3(2023)]